MNGIERDTQLLALIERQTEVLQTVADALGTLNRLDDERKGDIDELREEVAALGAKVDVLLKWKQALS